MKRSWLTVSLLSAVVILSAFTGLLIWKNRTPQETILRIVDKLSADDYRPRNIRPRTALELFTADNAGLIDSINSFTDEPRNIDTQIVMSAFGIHQRARGKSIAHELLKTGEKDDIIYNLCVFASYDSLEVPFYELLPPGFDQSNSYPAVILFSGHGDMEQVAFEKSSYQKGAALDLAKGGFVIFVMENRGMGKLAYLGNHLRIDAVARMLGGSWYGEITTDGLYLLELVLQKPYVNRRVGVGGVSSGAALSLIISAIDDRVISAYVQGYLGSYKTTFAIRGNHCVCNNITNILHCCDMIDIAALVFPRPILFVNGTKDGFYPRDATKAFEFIENVYAKGNAADNASIEIPEGVKHEFSTAIALAFFEKTLKN
jgi:hypothetical protein